MLSRVAENIYWMQRYRERAESVARYIDVNLNLMLDLPQNEEAQWEPFIQITGDFELFKKQYKKADRRNVVDFLVFNEDNPNSMLNSLYQSRENARTVRDKITKEMWHELNTTYLFVQKVAQDKRLMRTPHQFYERIKRQLQLFTHFSNTCMLHDEGWHFGRVGFYMERADQMLRLLDVKYFMLLPTPEHVGTPYDNMQWAAVLKSAGGFEMYRQKWHAIFSSHVVEFLLLYKEFPRSYVYCIDQVAWSLKAISGVRSEKFLNTPWMFINGLSEQLEKAAVEEILQAGLHEYIDQMQLQIQTINDSIYDAFFALVPVDLMEERF